MKRKKTFTKKSFQKRKAFALGVLLVLAIIGIGFSLDFAVSAETSQNSFVKKVLSSVAKEETVQIRGSTLSHDVQSLTYGNLLSTDDFTFFIESKNTPEESNHALSEFVRSETSTHFNLALEGDDSIVLSERRRDNDSKITYREVAYLLPGNTLVLTTESKLPSTLSLVVQCIGAPANRRDSVSQLRFIQPSKVESVEQIPANGKETTVRFSTEQDVGDYRFTWHQTSPCALVIKAVTDEKSTPNPGIILVTIDALQKSPQTLGRLFNQLQHAYGNANVRKWEGTWPYASSNAENLARLLENDELQIDGDEDKLELRVHQALKGKLKKENWKKLLIEIGNAPGCVETTCRENNYFSPHQATNFDLVVDFNRQQNLSNALNYYFSNLGDLRQTYLHLNIMADPQKISLSWESALLSYIPIGKWIVAGLLTKFDSRRWRTDEFRTIEKTQQIETMLLQLGESLKRDSLPHMVIVVHTLADGQKRSLLSDAPPVIPGAIFIASPSMGSEESRDSLIPSQAIVQNFFQSLGETDRKPTRSAESQTQVVNWSVDTGSNELFLMKNPESVRWLLLPSQDSNIAPQPISSNLELESYKQALEEVALMRTSRERALLFFRFFSSRESEEEFSLAFSSPIPFVQCYSNQKGRFSRLVKSDDSETLSTSITTTPSMNLTFACLLNGKATGKQNFALKALVNGTPLSSSEIGIGEFAERLVNEEYSGEIIGIPAADFLARTASEYFPRTAWFPSIRLFIWRSLKASPLLSDTKGMIPLLSEEDFLSAREKVPGTN